ncbi:MAG: hypothetical protein D3923_11020 [Candidatus Electrothrix sp. AR3]|nr:hypothetical protein [Candidatus Electrothrix sp. AR3]
MSKPFEPIAIIGRGCILPGAENPAALWKLVYNQKIALREATAEDWRIDSIIHPLLYTCSGRYCQSMPL